ncbi:MAG: RidA family protein [Bdellovibrionales bacterium]
MLKPIYTSKAPKPIGPYSQAMSVGPWLVCSGQIPLDSKTAEIVGEDVTSQTEQVLENIKAVLNSKGMNFQHVVKTLVFLTDLKNFEDFNKVYGTYFKNHHPARSCVEVSALPKSVLVEVEAWAYREEDK